MDRKTYRKAGAILATVREQAVEDLHADQQHSDLATTIEQRIRDNGAEPAFPVNISIDNEAAHRTPAPDEETVFTESDVVCLDIGVHVDGYIVDSAVTVDLSGDHTALCQAADDALDAAIDVVEAGASVSDIGTAVASTIEQTAYKPITNLSGHGLARWDAHCQPMIPNTRSKDTTTLSEGDVIAIEPFVTTGSGTVNATNNVEIYELENNRSVRNRTARQVLDELKDEYSALPFARRWLETDNASRGLRRLVRQGIVRAHPVLTDVDGSYVAQSEHTVYVTEDGCEVLTADEG